MTTRSDVPGLVGRMRSRRWFPQVPLAALLCAGGVWLLQVEFGRQWPEIVEQLVHGTRTLSPGLLPPLVAGAGMVIVAFGLLLRSRMAWAMAILLSAIAAASMPFGEHRHAYLLLAYFVVMLALLASEWRAFDRSSIAAGTVFALASMTMLGLYATLGAFYLGADFDPPIGSLTTALYYAVVTMSTVGYGDITPQTSGARMFTVSLILLGVAVFATSLTAVIGPVITRSVQHFANRRGIRMKRENHFIVIGNTPLAVNTWRELVRRGHPVTRLLQHEPETGLPAHVDAVVGDPGDGDVLRSAGADKARAVLAMLDDDSENAFVVLAVRELAGKARTVAAVNDAHHLRRVKLVQPDIVIAPQILGGELTAMLLSGEKVTADFVMNRVFEQGGHGGVAAPGAAST
ncbi:MAG: NAD-binding protein [Gemmatimonadaceae bacterium]|nr:NAD-binding protein [Gemmatimonadaceae bacterium]